MLADMLHSSSVEEEAAGVSSPPDASSEPVASAALGRTCSSLAQVLAASAAACIAMALF